CHGHIATHHARELARDGKAQPRPAVAAGGQGIGLGEILSLKELSTSPALLISLSVSPRPSSPAGFPDPLGRHASGGAAFAAPPVLPSRPTTSRAPLLVSLALMESLPSVPPEDPGSSPGVTR